MATIEKLDFAVAQLFDSKSQSGYLISLTTLLDFVDTDSILTYIFSLFMEKKSVPNIHKWFEENAKLRFSGIGSGRYTLPRKASERVTLLYSLFNKIVDEGETIVNDASTSWYGSALQWDYFMRDFVGMFYRDVRAMLVDLRVEAELSSSKDVKEKQIITIIMGGTNQLNQGNTLEGSSQIKQE